MMVVPKRTGGEGQARPKVWNQVNIRWGWGSGREANLALLLLNHLMMERLNPITRERQQEGREGGVNLGAAPMRWPLACEGSSGSWSLRVTGRIPLGGFPLGDCFSGRGHPPCPLAMGKVCARLC